MTGMARTSTSHSRLMRQPGPVAPDRFTVGVAPAARSARVHLGEGRALLEALAEATEKIAGTSDSCAVFTLLSGRFQVCVHCLAAPDESGRTVATYTPWKRNRDVDVIGGSATFGFSLDGSPMVHCHAWFVAAAGAVLAGHLYPGATVIGAGGLVVRATQLDRIAVRQTRDPETNHAVFMPQGEVG